MKQRILKQLYELFRQEWPTQVDSLGEMTPSTPIFYRGINLDSVDGVMLICAIEEEFDLQLDQESLTPEPFTNLDALADYIAEQMQTGDVS